MAFSPNVGVAIAARMLLGAGDAAVFPGVLRLISTWFPAQRAPVMVQMTGIFGQLGQIIAIIPLAALLHATTWSIAFGSLAGLGVLFTVLVFGVIRNHPPDRRPMSPSTPTRVRSGSSRPQSTTVSASGLRGRTPARDSLSGPTSRRRSRGPAFIMLWGIPFLTEGEGTTPAQAAAITTTMVLAGIAFGPVLGALSTRLPHLRSHALVLPTVAVQMLVWLVVIAWPGPAPLWLLLRPAIALATGGPASMIAFDHARTHNPSHRLSTATDHQLGGFLAGLIAVYLIGVSLDLQGAGTPDTYSLEAFRFRLPDAGATVAHRDGLHHPRVQAHPHPDRPRQALAALSLRVNPAAWTVRRAT